MEEFIRMRSEFKKLQEEVASLKEEIEAMKESDRFTRGEGASAAKEEESAVLKDESLSFKKLSGLLKSTAQLELNEQEEEEASKKEGFDFSKNRMPQSPSPFSMKDSMGERLSHSQSSNKHSIKVRGGKKRQGTVHKNE